MIFISFCAVIWQCRTQASWKDPHSLWCFENFRRSQETLSGAYIYWLNIWSPRTDCCFLDPGFGESACSMRWPYIPLPVDSRKRHISLQAGPSGLSAHNQRGYSIRDVWVCTTCSTKFRFSPVWSLQFFKECKSFPLVKPCAIQLSKRK